MFIVKRRPNNFVYFFESLVKLCSNLRFIRAIGTDGDLALMNASAICFPDAKKLLCSTHKKENIQRHLHSKLRAIQNASNHIICDIFGRKTSSISENGLISAKSEEEFDNKLANVKSVWDHIVPDFHSWFVKYEADYFKCNLIASVTLAAGLSDGNPYSNNRVESVNKNVKDWVGKTGHVPMGLLNTKMEQIIKDQRQSFDMAIFSQGQYELCKEFSQHRVERHIWNSMSSAERENAVKKLWESKYIPQKRAVATVVRPDLDDKVPSEDRTPSKCTKTLTGDHHLLDVAYSKVHLEGISDDHIADMWNKAETLLNSKDICDAPGVNNAKFVKSEKGGRPHFVSISNNGKIVCENCAGYNSLQICSHSIAVAQSVSQLSAFVKWRQAIQTKQDLLNLINSGTAPSGKKRWSNLVAVAEGLQC